VSPLKSLRAVKDQADQFKTQLNRTLYYEEYSSIVVPDALNYGTSFKLKPKVEEITNYIDNSSSKNQKSTKTYEFGGGFSVTDGHTLSPLTNR